MATIFKAFYRKDKTQETGTELVIEFENNQKAIDELTKAYGLETVVTMAFNGFRDKWAGMYRDDKLAELETKFDGCSIIADVAKPVSETTAVKATIEALAAAVISGAIDIDVLPDTVKPLVQKAMDKKK